MYSCKEIYYTIQGEGGNSGRPAVFCRFTGCNLWTGHEKDRSRAVCQFCDTDFVGTDGPGGAQFESAKAVARAVAEAWPAWKAARAAPDGAGQDAHHHHQAVDGQRPTQRPQRLERLCR
ncbi:MAG TPA: hypothetical protein VJT09_12390, partial [Pyrinomonadaceae bacterium]|nr:hypothetical protein [Pyrinomonadaceae bacterium]